jgi:acetolactate synthase-1/2/3 large subunit
LTNYMGYLNMIRVSDYIISFINEKCGVDTFFTVSGGGCIFLIDALGRNTDVKFVATHHEQTAALAAEGYARINNKLGACVVTSGPGGTNALTGTLCSWQDSIPVIFISGQVNKEMTTNFTGLNMRQLGDQEFNIVETVKNMTKYSVQVNDPLEIRFHLEKATWLALNGRPGPVWLDIPLNVQSAKIEPETLKSFYKTEELSIFKPTIASDEDVDFVKTKLNNAKRPLLIVGNGIRLSNGVSELYDLLKNTNIPVISAVNGNDIVNEDYKYYYGRFGTHAQICANKIIQESDLILSVGTRLYVRQIGYNFSNFGKNAYKIHVDIDELELNKPTLNTDKKIHSDAKYFLSKLSKLELKQTDVDWVDLCDSLKKENPKVLQRHRDNKYFVSNYFFIERLNTILPKDYDIVTSDGSANVVTMQVLDLHGNQRLFTSTGCAPMGYGLPAAIGASVGGKNILCIEGDGSLQMNIQELQTLKHHNLPIKMILINNDGYTSIKITQKSFFDGRFVASEKNSGISFPNFEKVIKAYGLEYMSIKNNSQIDTKLKNFFNKQSPVILEVFTDPNEFHEPKVVAKLDNEGNFIPGELQDIQWID